MIDGRRHLYLSWGLNWRPSFRSDARQNKEELHNAPDFRANRNKNPHLASHKTTALGDHIGCRPGENGRLSLRGYLGSLRVLFLSGPLGMAHWLAGPRAFMRNCRASALRPYSTALGTHLG